jgi:hypothetical protein
MKQNAIPALLAVIAVLLGLNLPVPATLGGPGPAPQSRGPFPSYVWIIVGVALLALAASFTPRKFLWLKSAKGVVGFRVGLLTTAIVLSYWAINTYLYWTKPTVVY